MDGERRIRIKAIVLGLLTNVVGSAVVNGGIGIVFTMSAIRNGGDPQEIQALFTESTDLIVGMTAIGLVFAILGGYVAGRVAKERTTMHGLWVGIVSVAIAIILWFVKPSPMPILILAASDALTIGATALGGYLATPDEEPA